MQLSSPLRAVSSYIISLAQGKQLVTRLLELYRHGQQYDRDQICGLQVCPASESQLVYYRKGSGVLYST